MEVRIVPPEEVFAESEGYTVPPFPMTRRQRRIFLAELRRMRKTTPPDVAYFCATREAMRA